jgi:hypothetical protein
MMFHPFQCCKFLHGEFFDCVCIRNVANFFVDIFGYASNPFNVAKFITLTTFIHNVNQLPKLQEEILDFFTTQIHYVLMKLNKIH